MAKNVIFKKDLNNSIYFSYGNKKLVNGEETFFLIWSLPAIKTCPYATLLCKKFCYARKAEIAYPNCLESRTRNFEESLKDTFVDDAIARISYELASKKVQGKKLVVRIHESGDFYNEAYADKWLAIARHFKKSKNIVFMAYTKSIVYFNGKDIPKNFVIRFSQWEDTDKKQIELATAMKLPIYTADTEEKVNAMVLSGEATKCRCSDCGTCKKCWSHSAKNFKLVCVIH